MAQAQCHSLVSRRAAFLRGAHAQETGIALGIALELRLQVNSERSLSSRHTRAPVNRKESRVASASAAASSIVHIVHIVHIPPSDVCSQLLLCTVCHEHTHMNINTNMSINKNWTGHTQQIVR